MIKFSVVIIAFNEAHRMEPLLKSIRGADEVIVVDSMSTDQTAELAKSYGAKVIQQEFLGFGQQKQCGVDAAQNDWVFSLDADEVPDDTCWNALHDLCKNEPSTKAWFIQRHLVFMGKAFKYGREARDKQLRFFDRRTATWSTPEVHEKVLYDGKTDILPGSVAHTSYDSIANYLDKFNRYTSLPADELNKRGKSRSKLMNMLGVPINFFKFYILQLNLLNGYAGFCWSVFSSIYTLVKYSKAAEK